MPTRWEDDPADAPTLLANIRGVLTVIAAQAPQRATPSVAMAQQWHRDVYAGIAAPYPYYAGEVRDSDPRFPDLIGYEVIVGGVMGVPSARVPQALDAFERGTQTAVSRLDAAIAPGAPAAALTPPQLHGVLTLMATLHGEWIRIHPFANGNGRTARLWANWAALRYGLPPCVSAKPRPRQPYGMAAAASMAGDDRVMLSVLHQMLQDALATVA